jgi:IS4 transposase
MHLTKKAISERIKDIDVVIELLDALYHERWEIEGVFDEFKTHLRANSTVLRSKTPELVRQELWGLLLAQAASAREFDPDRRCFIRAVRVIKRKMPQAAAPLSAWLPGATRCWPRSRAGST